MRFVLTLVLLVLCVEVADAGPLLDRLRERREARQAGGPIFPRLAGSGPSCSCPGCECGVGSQSYQQSGTIYYYTLPAGGGCANGQCPIPARK